MQKLASPERRRYLQGPVAFVFSAAKTGSWRIDRPVFQSEKCTSCSLCQKACPAGSLTVDKDNHFITFDLEFCKGCGICMTACARECISMVPEREFV